MSTGTIPHLVPLDWYLHEYIAHATDGRFVALDFYADGTVRVEHLCNRGDRGVVIAGPALQLAEGGHRIVQGDPLNYDRHKAPLTVEPSVLCPDCGLHGFIRDGGWVSA